jgi:glyoxylate reductase
MPGPAEEMLAGRGYEVTVGAQEAPYPPEAFARLVRGADALLVAGYDRVTGALLDAAGGGLKIVANYAVGLDNIDLDAAAARGVKVSNTPDVLNEAVAEQTIALMLAAARRIAEGDRFVRAASGEPWTTRLMIGCELKGKTLGVIGPGRIGAVTAKIACAGFGMKLLYMDVKPNDALERAFGAQRVDLAALLESADVIALHVPLTDETKGMIGRDELARMKSSAILVNTARGEVVDEAALIDALRSGAIAAAGLDVFHSEPEPDRRLLSLDNVVLTPHLGSATVEARAAMSRLAAENIIAALEGRPPPSPADAK